MVILFGSLREQYSVSNINVTTPASGGTIPIGESGFIYVSGRNRSGQNLNTSAIAFSTTSNTSRINIELLATLRASGEDLFEAVISYYPSNSPTLAKQIAKWKAKDSDQVTLRSLPANVTVTELAQLDTSAVADGASLPTNPLNGMNVFVNSDGKYYEYDDEATSGTYPSGAGFWLETNFDGLTYRNSTTNGGSDSTVPSGLPADFLRAPAKVGDNPSIPVQYWLLNGFTEGAGEILTTDTAVTLKVEVAGVDKTQSMGGYVKIKFLGYVQRSTGELDTGIPTSGTTYTWYPTLPLTLPANLNRGFASAYEVFLDYKLSEVNNIINDGDEVFPYLTLASSTGVPSDSTEFTGDAVWNVTDRLRIYPGRRGGGQMSAKTYRTRGVVPSQAYSGLLADTPEQIAAISAAANGQIAIRQGESSLLGTEVIRAFVGTAAGVGQLSNESNTVAITAGETLQVTVTHPVNNALWAIRSNYPDRIAGDADIATLGPPEMRVFVDFDGTIHKMDNLQFLVGGSTTQIINISDLTGSTIIGSLPTIPADFDVYRQETAPVVSATGGGALLAGNYKVYVAYYYPSPNLVPTKIDHEESSGCIIESAGTAGDVTNELKQSVNIVTTSSYVQPGVGSTVTVDVNSVALLTAQLFVQINSAGTYEIISVNDLELTILNIGSVNNQPPGTNITDGKKVVPSGPKGDSGVDAGLPYIFDSNTTIADPGAGGLRFNSATYASVTEIAISGSTAAAGNPDVSGFINTWDDSTNTSKGYVQVTSRIAQENFAIFEIFSLVDNSGWFSSNVVHSASNGTITGDIDVSYYRTGDEGLDGADGLDSGLPYVLDAGTGMTDPGAGNLRFNNVDPSLATAIAISVTSDAGANVKGYLDTWDQSNSATKGAIKIFTTGNEANVVYYDLDNSTDNTTFYVFDVTHLTLSGTISGNIQVEFVANGDKGDPGTLSAFEAWSNTTGQFNLPTTPTPLVEADAPVIDEDPADVFTYNPVNGYWTVSEAGKLIVTRATILFTTSGGGTATYSGFWEYSNDGGSGWIPALLGAVTIQVSTGLEYTLDCQGEVYTQVPDTLIRFVAGRTSGGHTATVLINDYSNYLRDQLGGEQGPVGSIAGIPFDFDSSTDTATDPGSGNVRLNNADLSLVTEIAYSDNASAPGSPDVSAILLTWADSTSTDKGKITIQNQDSINNFGHYQVVSVSDQIGFVVFTVIHVSSAGTLLATTVTNFNRTGDKGDQGLTGSVSSATSLNLSEIAEPASPAATEHELYFDTADSKLKSKDSGGTVTEYGSGGGVGNSITLPHIATPSAPAAGFTTFYVDMADAKFKSIDSSGTILEYLTTATGASDPPFADVVLLLNGSDFLDKSNSAKTVTQNGTISTTAADPRFSGGSSYSLNGTTDFLTIPDSADWFDADYTIQISFNLDSIPGSGDFYSLVGQRVASGTGVNFAVSVHDTTKLFIQKPGGSSVDAELGALSTGTWYDLALVFSGGQLEVFLDAVSKGTTPLTMVDVAADMVIGASTQTSAPTYSFFFPGKLTNIRYSKGHALTIVPLTAPFPES